jgi:hypothetical protein
MNQSINHTKNLAIIVLPLFLFAILILIVKSNLIEVHSFMSIAIAIDLLLIIPFLYFLLIRKTSIPKTTVVPVMIIGLILGSYLLPQEDQTFLTIFKTWALPVIELSIVAFVVFKVRKAQKKYKSIKGSSPDFFIAVKQTCSDLVPQKLVAPMATEIAVMYYGFINWKKPILGKNEYTYHKNSGTPSLMVGFILIIAIETVGLHFLLARWNIVVAWILTGLSIYTALQVFGFAKSLSKRPIAVNANSIHLKYGILNEVEIPFSNIESIELSKKELVKNDLTKTLSPLGEMESHNVVIKLKSTCELVGLYGFKKKFMILGLHIDQPDRFVQHINNSMPQGNL